MQTDEPEIWSGGTITKAELLILCISVLVVPASGCTAGTGPDYSRTPVVFVHGHGMSSGDWDDMIRQLSRAGYPREYLYSVDIEPNKMGNVDAAQTVIAPAVDSLLDSARSVAKEAAYPGVLPQRVDLVSHSMGAVSSRWYATRMKPENVRVWISIGGANHGTNALCGHSDEGAADLCPAYATDPDRNLVQVLLNGTSESLVDETPWGIGPDPNNIPRVAPDEKRRIAYYTIRIEPDPWIEPAKSATLVGGGVAASLPDDRHFRETSPGNLLLLTDMRHDDLPWEDDVIAIVEFLLGQDFATE